MKYDPALDGIRTIAISAVVVYHFNGRLLPGGWAGVDLFFVLSGYLITTVLMDEIRTKGRISVYNFYRNRFLRLAPAFAFLLVALSVDVALNKSPKTEYLEAIGISAVYLMNLNRIFDWFPEWCLGHTWSLAMEEQFYLLWPAILVFINRKIPIFWISLAITSVVSWKCYLAIQGVSPGRINNGFDTHGDALLMGCVISFFSKRWDLNEVSKTWAAPSLLIAALFFALPAQSAFAEVSWLTIAALTSSWLIVASKGPSPLRSFLCLTPLVFTGRISYGWYLWHYPALVFFEKYGILARLAALVLSYAMAVFSYYAIERFFIRLKHNRGATDAMVGAEKTNVLFIEKAAE